MYLLPLLLLNSAILAAAPSRPADSAITRVIREFNKYGTQVTALPITCLSFEKTDPSTVLLREIHSPHCGGDPQTSPLVATFLVKKGRVWIEDPISGEAQPFGPSKVQGVNKK